MSDNDARLVFSQLMDTEPALPDISPYVAAAHAARRRRGLVYAAASAASVGALIAGVFVVPSMWSEQDKAPIPAASAVIKSAEEMTEARLTAVLSNNDWLAHGTKVSASGNCAECIQITKDPDTALSPMPRVLRKPPAPLEFRRVGYAYPADPEVPASYAADAKLTLGQQVADFTIHVTADRQTGCPKPDPSETPARVCSVAGNGDVISTRVRDTPDEIDVNVWRPDGTLVTVIIAARPNFPSERTGVVEGDGTFPITKEQLIELARDPGFSFHP